MAVRLTRARRGATFSLPQSKTRTLALALGRVPTTEGFVKRLLFLMAALVLAGCGENPVSAPPADGPGSLEPAGRNRNIGAEPRSRRRTVSRITPLDLNDEIVNESGRVIWSADGLGTTGATGTITIGKPSNAAVLRKAVFLAASTGFSGFTIPNGAMTIDGAGVTWDRVVPGAINNSNHMADVTAMVQLKLTAAGLGPVNFTISEGGNSSSIEGSALIVVWEDIALADTYSVVVLFGAQATSGDDFTINLSRQFFGDDPLAIMEMSLAISFGCNASGGCGSGAGGQFSEVDVNGNRVSSSAGGQNDGSINNGALFTMGGFGDSSDNPAPFAKATNGFDPDDEYYDLSPFVEDGALSVQVVTRNPSNDDNILAALFYMNPPGSVTTGPPPMGGDCKARVVQLEDTLIGALRGLQLINPNLVSIDFLIMTIQRTFDRFVDGATEEQIQNFVSSPVWGSIVLAVRVLFGATHPLVLGFESLADACGSV